MAKPRPVARPTKRAEYELVFGSSSAEKGWNDLRAGARNAPADAWDYLTAHPHPTAGDHPGRGASRPVSPGHGDLTRR